MTECVVNLFYFIIFFMKRRLILKKQDMALDSITLRSGLQFLSCEVENICRLCLKNLSFCDGAVELNQTLKLTNRDYFDEPVTLADVFVELGISPDKTLPQMLCETCTITVVNSFLLPKLLAHSKRTWYHIIQLFEHNLEKANASIHKSNSLYLPSTNNITQFLFVKKWGDAGKASALSILKDLRPTKIKPIRKKLCDNYLNKRICKRNLIFQYDENPLVQAKINQCKVCQETFKTKKAFKDHLVSAHGLYSCPICLELQPSKEKLKAHKYKHNSANNTVSVICPKCNKTYANKVTYGLHKQICGKETTRNFICDFCKQEYIRKNSLRTHIKITHGFGKLLSCQWCEKKFDCVSKLNEHVIKHTKIKTFTCEFCGKKCGTAASLACHIRLHTGERPFQCNLCDEKFLSASRRIEHIRKKHVGPHKKCDFCPAKYYTNAKLKKHIETHTNASNKISLNTILNSEIDKNMQYVAVITKKVTSENIEEL